MGRTSAPTSVFHGSGCIVCAVDPWASARRRVEGRLKTEDTTLLAHEGWHWWLIFGKCCRLTRVGSMVGPVTHFGQDLALSDGEHETVFLGHHFIS